MTTGIEQQISSERRAKLDALSKDELRYEISRGKDSVIGAKLIPYLQHRLDKIEDEERGRARNDELALTAEANRLSKEANEISRQANKHSWWAVFISVVAAVVGVIAILAG